MDIAVIVDNLPLYFQGLLVTIQLVAASLACGIVLAVPIARVDKTLRLPMTEVEQDETGHQLLVDGKRLPVRSLSECLRLNGRGVLDGDTLLGVVAQGAGGGTVFTVDEILGLQEVVVRPLGAPLERIHALNGVTLLEGGRPVFVLDPQKLR